MVGRTIRQIMVRDPYLLIHRFCLDLVRVRV